MDKERRYRSEVQTLWFVPGWGYAKAQRAFGRWLPGEIMAVARCFQWVAADDWEPRRGEKLKAQGNALGKVHAKLRALKGRNHPLVSPFQG